MPKTRKPKLLWINSSGILIALFFLSLIGRDLWLRRSAPRDCGDGPRSTIDIRDFTTQYSGYSIELEAAISDKSKASAKLSPQQINKLSEAVQSSREFRLWLIAGYNSCAINKVQYEKFGVRFQVLDSLAHEINDLSSKPSLSGAEEKQLAALVNQYGEMVGELRKD